MKLCSDFERRRAEFREKLGIGKDDTAVGIVARLTEIKNHKMFLRVAARYREKYGFETMSKTGIGKIRFLVIGDGQLRSEMENEALALGLENEVFFLGRRDDPDYFYPGLDIVSLTSLNEGTPLSLIEAMASRRACISTSVGGVVDILGEAAEPDYGTESEVNYRLCERGISAKSNDVEAFCDGLALLAQNKRLRNKLGERGREFIEQNYSKERLLKDIVNLYEEMLPSAKKRNVRPNEICKESLQ